MAAAEARTIKIVTAQTLELRNQGGQELVIISGENVEIRVDDDVVKAKRVELNRTRRTLTLVGAATYHTAKDGQDLEGENLVVDLGSEAVTGTDVLVSDADLEIRGAEIERVPGQLSATNGYFTPCAKCGRTPNDYAFRAGKLLVYPGDRLVAYRVQVLIADRPIFYLPVLVLPLNDRSRQPRVQVGTGQPDGLTVEADLPFSVGSSVLGTTLLRYYQNRSPSLGGGVDLRAYAPTRFVDRLDLYYLAQPRPFLLDSDGNYQVQDGYDSDLTFSVRGRVPLELALKDLEYTLNVSRREIGLFSGDSQRGVTNLNFSASADYPRFTVTVNDTDRFGPEPTTALRPWLMRPEVTVDVKPFTVSLGRLGDVEADFKFTAGLYTGESNPLSRRVSALGLNYTTTRLEEDHRLSYTRTLWTGADITASNAFTGRYYGDGARTVQQNFSVKFTQRWAGTNSFSVAQDYFKNEGTSPFAQDAVFKRRTAPLTVSLDTVPVKDTTFRATYTRDHLLQPGEQQKSERLSFGVTVNRAPVSLSYSLDYDFVKDNISSSSFSVTLKDQESGTLTLVPATPAVPATPTTPAVPARAAYYKRSSAWPFPNLALTASTGYNGTSGLQPLTLTATVTDGGFRSNYFSVTGTYDLQGHTRTAQLTGIALPVNGEERNLTSLSAAYNLISTTDTVLNPVTVSGNETLNLRTPSLVGRHSLTWRELTFSTQHNLNLEQSDTATDSGTITFSVGSIGGAATNWNLTYGGPYDLRRAGFTKPQLSGSFRTAAPGRRLSANVTVNTPGLDQPYTDITLASVNAAWQQSRFAVSGQATFTRTRSTTDPTQVTDTWDFNPFRVGVGFGGGPKPEFYLTASLRQRFTFLNGVRQYPTPLAPVLGFTWDRCCWALQGEYDMGQKRLRIALGLPGQTYSIFDRLDGSNTYPFTPFIPNN